MLFLLIACASQTTSAPPATAGGPKVDPTAQTQLRLHMAEHLSKATAARDAVAEGNLTEADASLAWLGDHIDPTTTDPTIQALLGLLTSTSKTAAGAKTLDEAGAGVGQVSDACARCHQSLQIKLSSAVATLPAGADASGGHKDRANWAVDALWTSVIASGDSAWTDGVTELQKLPQDAAGWGVQNPGPNATAAAATLKAFTASGADDQNRTSRSEALGKVVAACGSCHAEQKK